MTDAAEHTNPHPAAAANDTTAQLAIAGGGISGLSTAIYALEHGVPADQIHLFEGAAITGGKIQTEYLQGRPVNKGAEFIDSDQTKILEMAQKLGVPLTAADDQSTAYYHRPDGSVINGDAMRAAYKPIAERIIADKAELACNPKGALAQRLNAMSMDQYLDELAASTPINPERSLLKAAIDTVTFKSNHIDPQILATVKGLFVSEEGNVAGNISALQFANEHSANTDDILASDCAFRVEGGTAKLLDAMRDKLKSAGVHFHMNAPVQSVNKTADGKLHLSIGGEHPQQFETAKFVAALPTYALARINGLDTLGFTPEASKLISDTQYTNSIKFTVALKDGATADKSTFFSNKGFQCWSPEPHQVTFLANADAVTSGKINMKNFMQSCMNDYAKGMGKPVDALFPPLSAETVSLTSSPANPLTNPNAKPCYCSPKPGQMLELEKLGESMDALAANGVGIVGTFIPHRGPEGLGVGFMECGLNSAQHTCDILVGKEQARESWVSKLKAQQMNVGVAANDDQFKRAAGQSR